jgi:dihydrofolate reductase
MITVVAAVADNGVIGHAGGLPWRLPDDLRLFKQHTMGGVLVMGRRTYDSIGRPLPGRTTVVVTRSPPCSADGVLVAASLPEALATAGSLGEVFVVGGAAVYAAVLPEADVLLISRVHGSPEGDTYWPGTEAGSPLPDVDPSWREVSRTPYDGFDLVELVPAH